MQPMEGVHQHCGRVAGAGCSTSGASHPGEAAPGGAGSRSVRHRCGVTAGDRAPLWVGRGGDRWPLSAHTSVSQPDHQAPRDI